MLLIYDIIFREVLIIIRIGQEVMHSDINLTIIKNIYLQLTAS